MADMDDSDDVVAAAVLFLPLGAVGAIALLRAGMDTPGAVLLGGLAAIFLIGCTLVGRHLAREHDRRERQRRALHAELLRQVQAEIRRLAEEMLHPPAGGGRPKAPSRPSPRDLDRLGLDQMPTASPDLHRAYRLAMLRAHPDCGGSDSGARAVMEAYTRLRGHLPMGD